MSKQEQYDRDFEAWWDKEAAPIATGQAWAERIVKLLCRAAHTHGRLLEVRSIRESLKEPGDGT